MGASFWLAVFCFAYWMVNRPFRALACHQDAGWHSYWAAFRHRGVGLERQLNVLMGCARLGSKFLFVLWFALFGVGDPDRVARRVALVLNMLTALGAYLVLVPRVGTGPALAAAGVSLAVVAIPTFGTHYETAERTVRPLNLGLFAACLAYAEAPDSVTLGLIVAAMIGSALLFKITQLFEYLPLWLSVFLWYPGWAPFTVSSAGGFLAVAGFVVLLGALGLLKAENLGLFGYMASSRRGGRTNFRKSASELDARIEGRLAAGGYGDFVRTGVSIARRFRVLGLLSRFFGVAVNARQFVPTVMGPAKTLLVLTLFGLWLEPASQAKTLLVVWEAGALAGLLLQARFLPLHFVPLLLPASLLAGLGLARVAQAALAGETVGWMGLAAVALAVALDVRWGMTRRGYPLDLRFWPDSQHPIIARNLIARQLAPVMAARTGAEDHVLVWGCLPQLYLLAGRRCPVNWLSTNAAQMDPILPGWRAELWRRMRETRPVLILQVDDGLDLDEVRRETGLTYLSDDSGSGWRMLRLAGDAP